VEVDGYVIEGSRSGILLVRVCMSLGAGGRIGWVVK
jgi:hypothetical protein